MSSTEEATTKEEEETKIDVVVVANDDNNDEGKKDDSNIHDNVEKSDGDKNGESENVINETKDDMDVEENATTDNNNNDEKNENTSSAYVVQEGDISEKNENNNDNNNDNNNSNNNEEGGNGDGENTDEQTTTGHVNTRLDHILTNYDSNYDETKPETKCAISFEYYPPRTTESLKNLYEKLERMKKQKPLYTSITWGAGGSTAKVSFDVAKMMKIRKLIPNLHLTCTNMDKYIIKETLDDCVLLKINNVLALRGNEAKDPTEDEEGGLKSAIDLIKYMRENYNDWEFSIQTSGYPEGHPSKILKIDNPKMLTEDEKKRIIHRPDADYVCHEEEYQHEIEYLREKVDAGANVIITQFFFDVSVYISFVEKCREAGIDVPIVPGIMIILAYGSFKRIQDFSRCRVPDEVVEKMERLKKDAAGVQEYGIELATNMCKELLEYGVPALHFYTLNMEKSVNEVLKNIGRYIPVDDDKKNKNSSSSSSSSNSIKEIKVDDAKK